MNRLSTERRGHVISCLVEGMSIRSTVRITGVAKNTVVKLLIDLGQACSEYQDKALRNLKCNVIECDEIWSFCYSKQKNVRDELQDIFGYGDVWTWTAIDSETKLIPSWLVGERNSKDAYLFLSDLKSKLNPDNRVQITTDGHKPYLTVIEPLFGADNVDFAILHKIYGQNADSSDRTYSPATCTAIDKRIITGNPDASLISTSYVERQNLTMRMGRFTGFTNAFSKKVENHAHAGSLHFMHCNFARPHQALSKEFGRPTTPAMAAGITNRVWSSTDIAGLLD